MATIKIYKPKLNINFTNKSMNRVSFYSNNGKTIAENKTAFINKHFDTNNVIASAMNEFSPLDASFNLKIEKGDNLETLKAYNYFLAEVDGFKRFYFVIGTQIKNNETITYELQLDTITTYLDSNVNGNFTLTKGHLTPTRDNILGTPIQDIPKVVMKRKVFLNIRQAWEQKLIISDNAKWGDLILKYGVSEGITAVAKPNSVAGTTNGSLISDVEDGLGYFPLNMVTSQSSNEKNSPDRLLYVNANNTVNAFITPLPFISDLIEDTHNLYGYRKDADTTHDEYTRNPKESHDIQFDNPYVKHNFDSLEYSNGTPVLVSSLPEDVKTTYETDALIIRHLSGEYEVVDPAAVILNWADKDFGQDNDNYAQFIQRLDPVGGVITLDFAKPVFTTDYTGRKFIINNRINRSIMSSAYTSYVEGNANQIDNAKEQAKQQMKKGVASGIFGAISGAAGAAFSALNPFSTPSSKGAGIVGGISQVGTSIVGAVASGKDAQLAINGINARLNDIQNTPSSIIATGSLASYKEMMNPAPIYGDSGFLLTYVSASTTARNSINNHYYKFGYDCHINKQVSSIKDIINREVFTYVESDDFQEALNIKGIPVEVVNNISAIFQRGVRLWNYRDNVTVGDFDDNGKLYKNLPIKDSDK